MSQKIDFDYINQLAKRSLGGDLKSFEKLLNILEKYENFPQVKFGLYSLIYQLSMNVFIDVSKECEKCGGKCCKSGYPIPVYEFDYKELAKRMNREELEKLRRVDNIYLLPRPCPFQQGWVCTIHRFKPYACLSFPFATEDEQREIINNYDGKGIPDFKVPEYCIAGKKVKETLNAIISDLEKCLGRKPTPKELYQAIMKKKK
ncbi:hypothetical protein BFU36_08765 [Sulfolobus sp. A20]|uniref:YkgJ family cysteine cluster protein n=2 Tax=Sulfolobaceae TaxID=118883 RepID=UPI000845FF8D|nr:YkgJ family cysteine cluster protein [Sulfolobus sp. A20]TRM75001.1 YkgJ family cysteine cluster protein [Sulfolobus sp. E5]TRM75089.1 YkgJ family cysteine cluster protein [Sulfolobus sp. A20-N-F8]TRM79634.1 YkgJ family cysteine cluster protein [Sulfolobus sp. B5]TRM81550.1 YkgJ family cysteine cluster protein [Sulfolobus sp. D5]TRM83398.1 YkgJ family cysteine cluster protein [Sulfolobus sp. A20-N-F6]TRM85355.1 YkgJ family cysteine cluster protein [Sulfolobus sp. F3]TRM89057.1 YkgJ family